MRRGQLGILGTLVIMATMLTTNVLGAEVGVVTQRVVAYDKADVTSEQIGYVFEGETLDIVEEIGDFYGVVLEEDDIVYVEKSYFQVQELEEEGNVEEEAEEAALEVVSEPVEQEEVQQSLVQKEEVKVSRGQEIVAYAKKFIGTPYRSGGSSLTKGVDCSGFTQQVFLKFNVKLQRSSRDQYACNGNKIAKEQLQEGDLVFYGYNGRVNHVAIYIGNGQIIHSPVPGKSVCIEPLWQRGCAPIIGYKRVV